MTVTINYDCLFKNVTPSQVVNNSYPPKIEINMQTFAGQNCRLW